MPANLLAEQFRRRPAARGRRADRGGRGRRRWTMRTSRTCCTATSSRRIFFWPSPIRSSAVRCWPTSGSRAWSRTPAGLTATDMTVGTVAYAAPEQLMGHALDGRADQYALAATAFHLLTGQQLFQHDNPAVVISQHLTASPPAIGDRMPSSRGWGRRSTGRWPEGARRPLRHVHGLRRGDGAWPVRDGAGPGRHRRDDGRSCRGAAAGSRRRAGDRADCGLGLLAAVVGRGAHRCGGRDRRSTSGIGGSPSAQPAPSAPTAGAPAVPVVLIGADCETLGGAGVSTTGQAGVLLAIAATGDQVWSVYTAQCSVPEPTATPDPTDEVYPAGIEEQVQVCVSQTEKTRAECREDVRNGNITGPA